MSKSPLEIGLGDLTDGIVNVPDLVEGYAEMQFQINQAATRMLGAEVIWFRALPHENGEDVIFQAYTLYNVEDCPTSIRMHIMNAEYDASSYEVDFFGINYNFPLEIQCDIKTWEDAYGKDTMPQKRDILYIPLYHKIYEVASTSKMTGFMGRDMGYKIQATKYNPKASRRESAALQDTLDQYTVGIQDLFGAQISDEVADIVQDETNSGFSGRILDDYKLINSATVVEEHNLFTYKQLVSKNYYIGAVPPSTYSIEYKTGDKFNIENDNRILNLWFQVRRQYNYTDVFSIAPNEKQRQGKYYLYDIKFKTSTPIERGSYINVINKVTGINLNAQISKAQSVTSYTIKVPASDIFKLQREHPNWINQRGFVCIDTPDINLFKGVMKDGTEKVSVSLLNGSMLQVKVNNYESILSLNTFIKSNVWTALSLSIGDENNVYVYSNENIELEPLFKGQLEDIRIRNKDVELDRYYIPSGYFNITNIRLYDLSEIPTEEAIKKDLASYNTTTSSKAIINDVAVPISRAKYMGEQR